MVVTWLVYAAMVYLAVGVLFSIWLSLLGGMGKVDPAAGQGTLAFKLLAMPGTWAFWPVFVIRLSKGKSAPPLEHNAHRGRAAGGEGRT